MGRKQEDLFAKESTDIRMEISEGKLSFVKDNVTRNIDTARRDVKEFDSFVLGTISNEHALRGAKHKFAIIVWTEIRPAGTSEHTERLVVRFDVEKAFEGCFIVNDTTRKHIDNMHGSEECFVPKLERHGGSC